MSLVTFMGLVTTYPEEQWVLADSLDGLEEVSTNLLVSFASQQHTALHEGHNDNHT